MIFDFIGGAENDHSKLMRKIAPGTIKVHIYDLRTSL